MLQYQSNDMKRFATNSTTNAAAEQFSNDYRLDRGRTQYRADATRRLRQRRANLCRQTALAAVD